MPPSMVTTYRTRSAEGTEYPERERGAALAAGSPVGATAFGRPVVDTKHGYAPRWLVCGSLRSARRTTDLDRA
jgi:hypothetical protein